MDETWGKLFQQAFRSLLYSSGAQKQPEIVKHLLFKNYNKMKQLPVYSMTFPFFRVYKVPLKGCRCFCLNLVCLCAVARRRAILERLRTLVLSNTHSALVYASQVVSVGIYIYIYIHIYIYRGIFQNPCS